MLFSKVSTVLLAISRTLSGFSRTTLSLPYKYKSDNNPSFFTKGMIVFPDMNEETLSVMSSGKIIVNANQNMTSAGDQQYY
jgi:hypothetical protein